VQPVITLQATKCWRWKWPGNLQWYRPYIDDVIVWIVGKTWEGYHCQWYPLIRLTEGM